MNIPFDIPSWDYLELKEKFKDPNLDEKLRQNITEGLIEKARETINHEMSFDLQIYARKGKGKSNFALKVKEEHLKMKHETDGYSPEDHFNFEEIFFTTEAMEKWFKENPEKVSKTSLILDEQIKNWGAGSYINIEKLATWSETLRKRSVNFFYCSPTARYASAFQYDFLIQPVALTSKHTEKGTVLLSCVFTRSNNMIGTVFTTLPSKFVQDGYNKMKDEALDMFTTLQLHEADRFKDVVDYLIDKYKLKEMYDAQLLWDKTPAKERVELNMVKPPRITKKRIQAFMEMEGQRFSLNESDVISELIGMTLEMGDLTERTVKKNEGLAEEELGTPDNED